MNPTAAPTQQQEGPASPQERLDALLTPLREIVVELVPEVEHTRPEGTAPESFVRWKPHERGHFRTLDHEKVEAALCSLDHVIGPVHAIAAAAFQRMVDQISGFACPTLQGNLALVHAIMDRVDRFGLGLYVEQKGQIGRVRFSAHQHAPSQCVGATPESIAAGKIRAVGSKEPVINMQEGGGGSSIAVVASRMSNAFPEVVVASCREEAAKIFEARKAARMSAGTADDV